MDNAMQLSFFVLPLLDASKLTLYRTAEFQTALGKGCCIIFSFLMVVVVIVDESLW